MPFGSELPDDRSRRRAHLNTAGASQVSHAGDPGTWYIGFQAHLLERLCQPGIGVLRQKDALCAARKQSFFQLLDAYHRLAKPQDRQIAALRYSTILFSIHTR